jgi:hypothetical protein
MNKKLIFGVGALLALIIFTFALSVLGNFVLLGLAGSIAPSWLNYGLVTIFVLSVFAILFYLTTLMEQTSGIRAQILEARKDIHSSVTPKFLNVSIETNDLIELAIEVWRLESRINRNLSTLPENQRETLVNSVQKLKRYLNKNDIEVIDYTNQKYTEGRNLEILAVEKDPHVTQPIIKETKEPTVLCKGQVVRKGKVILLANSEVSKVQNE